jgi:hypothetical protein
VFLVGKDGIQGFSVWSRGSGHLLALITRLSTLLLMLEGATECNTGSKRDACKEFLYELDVGYR